MLVVTKSPARDYGEQSENRGQSSRWHGSRTFVAGADLFVDQRKQCGENQSQRENDEQDGLDDEHDVPGNPALGEWPEGTHSIVISEVEENVAETGQAGIGEEQSPARGQIRIAGLTAAQAPEQIDKSNDHGGHERHAEKRMGEAAVMVQTECGASEAAQDVEVGGFSRQG